MIVYLCASLSVMLTIIGRHCDLTTLLFFQGGWLNLWRIYQRLIFCCHFVCSRLTFFCCLNFYYYGTTSQDEAVEKVIEFMELYSISMEDFDTIVELSKFKVHQTLLSWSHLVSVLKVLELTFLLSWFRGIQVHWMVYSLL